MARAATVDATSGQRHRPRARGGAHIEKPPGSLLHQGDPSRRGARRAAGRKRSYLLLTALHGVARSPSIAAASLLSTAAWLSATRPKSFAPIRIGLLSSEVRKRDASAPVRTAVTKKRSARPATRRGSTMQSAARVA